MQLLLCLFLLIFLSCGQQPSKQVETGPRVESLKTVPDSARYPAEQKKTLIDSTGQVTSAARDVNQMLEVKFGDQWHVITDAEANWSKDQFDYFIAGKRKNNPDYPYIAKGDFNGDNKPDIAAIVRGSNKADTRLAIILGPGNISLWKDDVKGAAISIAPKSDIEGIEGAKAKMKCEGINVEFFEQSSYVIYWNGSAFRNIWTSD